MQVSSYIIVDEKRENKHKGKHSMMNQTPSIVCKVEKSGNRFNAYDTNGTKRTSEISTSTRSRAFTNGKLLGRFTTSTGKYQWRLIGTY